MFDTHFSMSWQDWAANLCYLILAVSYLVSDLYWLRVLAVLALGLEGIYFYFGSTRPLWVGIGWAAVFVAINIVQLVLMTRERLAVRLSERERLLHRGLFAELTSVQFNRFLHSGVWRQVDEGALLTTRGEPVPELLLIVEGSVKVTVGDQIIALQQAGSFVGEMSFMSGEQASATVSALGNVMLLAVSRPALDRLLGHDQSVATVLMRVIGHGLAKKLKARQPQADNRPN